MDENNVVTEGQEQPGQTPSTASQAEPTDKTPSSEDTSLEGAAQEGAETEGEESGALTKPETRSLSERTQKRIRTLIGERNEEIEKRKAAETRTRELEGLVTSGGQATSLPKTETTQKALEQDPQLREAVEKLKKIGGFVTDKDLETYQNRMLLETQHSKMEQKYPGDKDMPKYDPVEVEDYMRRARIYNPEVAYLNLYDKERIQKAKKEALTQTETPYSESPGKSSVKKKKTDKDVITREKIDKMSDTEYEANRERILKLAEEGKL